MKKLFCMLIVALASPLLSGCYNVGSSAEPPPDFKATPGDGRVVLTWTATPGINYWVFTANDPSLTAFVWTNLTNAHVYQQPTSPLHLCGLVDGIQYWFAANARIGGGPGGPSSPTLSAIPYKAGSVWSANAPLTRNLISPNLLGVGYASLMTCLNNLDSAGGSFAAVGANGAIFTSPDGANWNSQAAPAGFSSDLYSVTGYAALLNYPINPGLRWVAVGAGGASIYSTDGVAWAVGRPYDISSPALRSVTHVGGTYFAVGDAGTLLVTTDGITWGAIASGTTNNLNGITAGVIYAAVGDGGTILVSANGSTWAAVPSVTTNNLRQATSVGYTFVAVGDNGTITTSSDAGGSWTVQTLPGAPNLVSVAANAQLSTLDINGLAFTAAALSANAQFVAIDSSGNAYTSADGFTWSAPIPTGAPSLNALISSGFGYVAAGNSGATATAF